MDPTRSEPHPHEHAQPNATLPDGRPACGNTITIFESPGMAVAVRCLKAADETHGPECAAAFVWHHPPAGGRVEVRSAPSPEVA